MEVDVIEIGVVFAVVDAVEVVLLVLDEDVNVVDVVILVGLGVVVEVTVEDPADVVLVPIVVGVLVVVGTVTTVEEPAAALLLLVIVVLTPVLQMLPIPHVQSSSLGSVAFE